MVLSEGLHIASLLTGCYVHLPVSNDAIRRPFRTITAGKLQIQAMQAVTKKKRQGGSSKDAIDAI